MIVLFLIDVPFQSNAVPVIVALPFTVTVMEAGAIAIEQASTFGFKSQPANAVNVNTASAQRLVDGANRPFRLGASDAKTCMQEHPVGYVILSPAKGRRAYYIRRIVVASRNRHTRGNWRWKPVNRHCRLGLSASQI